MNEPLKRVGQYRFIRQIGKGATSEVFEAKKEGSGDRYAVKMIRLRGVSNEQKDMVTKQVNIIKNIQHPNIVHLFETFETSNNFYLVFEFCERGDLEKYLQEYHGPRLPEETAQRIIYCIADAVRLIHSKGIAHRDIKLANILLKKNYEIKLADFGFAKEGQNLFMETYCGTPITMAPEIMLSRPYDKKVDIWSLGIIVFQLIYGKLPFSTTDGLPKFMEYVTEQALSIPTEPPTPPEFKQLIIGCLEKNPDSRFNIDQFIHNKWVQEGSEDTLSEGQKKKPSVDELLRKISPQIKVNSLEKPNQSNEIELLIAQRVNKNLVVEFQKIINQHEQTRTRLMTQAKGDDAMQNLILKLDHSYVEFLSNISVKVGKEQTCQFLKASELIGLKALEPMVEQAPDSERAGNVLMTYLQKLSHETYSTQEKLERYRLASDVLDLIKRFDIRIVIKFANHIYEDIEVENVIEHIRKGHINEELSQQVEYSTGNFITLAIESSDKDDKMKKLRETLKKNFQKRLDEIEKEEGQYL